MVKIVNTVNIARAVLLLPVVTVQGTSCYTTVLQLTRQSVFSCLTRASCFDRIASNPFRVELRDACSLQRKNRDAKFKT